MSAFCNVTCASSDVPASASSASNTQRIVNTVGPASSRTPAVATSRILPPGASARSSTVTRTPCRARSNAAASPAIPAPTMITEGSVIFPA